ncbi:MAG: MotA/TolQ/ExbB proton channel family protein [Thioalkalivibrionaceae bacterium]
MSTGESSIMMFVNVPSVLIVFGGASAAMLIRFPLKHVIGSIKVGLRTIKTATVKPEDIIKTANEMAQVARKNGVMALDGFEVDDPFFKRAAQLVADGNKPEFVQAALREDMQQTIERHETGQKFFRTMGDAFPAFGMIGTLIGLIQMLTSLDDPAAIGPAMAIALLTTLYGALIANLVALPIADKLEVRSAEERINKLIIISSMAAIQEGTNPRLINELLEAYVSRGQREKLQQLLAGGGAEAA